LQRSVGWAGPGNSLAVAVVRLFLFSDRLFLMQIPGKRTSRFSVTSGEKNGEIKKKLLD
jgi:hypothetical protein